MFTLYHSPASTCSQKVRFVLAEKGLEWESKVLNLRKGDQFDPEYLKINPKGVVPVLIDGDQTLTESAIICEYLNDKFPDPPLMPSDPLSRARVRLWMQPVDDYLHLDTSTLSYAIVFRDELREAHKDDEEGIKRQLSTIPDARRRAVLFDIVENGIHCEVFDNAFDRYCKFIDRMGAALADTRFLVEDRLSLADIICLPYIGRLRHLGLGGVWERYPGIVAWYQRMQETHGYRQACAKWITDDMMAHMKAKGRALWPELEKKMP